MTRSSRLLRIVAAGALLCCLAGHADAIEVTYELSWSTIDGGGATFSTGGSYELGGTAGQPDAGLLSGGGYTLAGGFWTFLQPSPTPTPTLTPTKTATPTAPVTPTYTTARTPTATTTRTSTGNQTMTPTGTPNTTPPPSVPPTGTATPSRCIGDCSNDRAVTVDEILAMVNIALGNRPVGDCVTGDRSGDGTITVDEILAAVSAALNRCN